MNSYRKVTFGVVIACGIAAEATFACPARAGSGTEIGVDADGAIPLNTRLLNGGGGFGVRLGKEFHIPLVRLTPELGYGYMHLFADQAPSDWETHRLYGGLRLGVGELLVPYAFLHAGYGWRSASLGPYGGGGAAFDGGLGLDLNLGFISVGAHVGYGTIDVQPAPPQWVILGLNAALVF
jgi:hypothetical protein